MTEHFIYSEDFGTQELKTSEPIGGIQAWFVLLATITWLILIVPLSIWAWRAAL